MSTKRRPAPRAPRAERPIERVGVIADTHGLVRPEALAALAGSQLILHAGDIGQPAVLAALGAVAEVVAVRGNNDRGPWARALPETELAEVGACAIYLVHILDLLDLTPAPHVAAVVSGHSHQPAIAWKDGVLYLNPGSAGPRRFGRPITLARLTVKGGTLTPEIVPLRP